MTDIESLTVRVRDLTESVDWWNVIVIGALILAAAAAVAVGFTTWIVVMKGKQLAATQTELISAKDKQLALDLAEKDSAIADAKKLAAEANRVAEQEKLARVKIEERLAWRRVDPTRYASFVEELKSFTGAVVSLIPLGNGDPETETFTDDIAKLLTDSQWRVSRATGNTVIPAPRGLICRVNEGTPAGQALSRVLKHLPGATVVPTGLNGEIAVITIGIKPPP